MRFVGSRIGGRRTATSRRRGPAEVSNVRTADDLEHVGGGGLLLQRLAQIFGPRLNLVEQPHVLDRDHGLVGKGLQQLDVMGGEGAGLLPRDHDQADRRSLAHQRREQRSCGSRAPATTPSWQHRGWFRCRATWTTSPRLCQFERSANRQAGRGKEACRTFVRRRADRRVRRQIDDRRRQSETPWPRSRRATVWS